MPLLEIEPFTISFSERCMCYYYYYYNSYNKKQGSWRGRSPFPLWVIIIRCWSNMAASVENSRPHIHCYCFKSPPNLIINPIIPTNCYSYPTKDMKFQIFTFKLFSLALAPCPPRGSPPPLWKPLDVGIFLVLITIVRLIFFFTSCKQTCYVRRVLPVIVNNKP